MSESYLKPRTANPLKRLKQRNGMFINPPEYPQLGGFYSSQPMQRKQENMTLEKSPQSRGSKPL